MNAETIQIFAILSFIISGIFSVMAVILFFRLNIKAISDDLSGKTVRKQVKELREQNRGPDSRKSNKIFYEVSKSSEAGMKTVEERTARLEETGTTLLKEEGTVLLQEEGTVLLSGREMPLANGYRLLLNVMEIHSEERI